jgi:hypothetical protein
LNGDFPDKLCPDCGGKAVGLARNFKAPSRTDVKQWKKVAFLVEHGFWFAHQYGKSGDLVPYPATMTEAKEFVRLYGNAK